MTGSFRPFGLVVMPVVLFLIGCGTSETSGPSESAPPVLRADSSAEPPAITTRELRRKLRANDLAKFKRVGNNIVEAELFQAGVEDLSALQGLPLRFLDLGMNAVSDLSPLKGMPLKALILEDTQVADLTPLQGMQLEELQLQNTKVTDLSVLKGMPLKRLNLLALPIQDVTPFANMPLETLWLNETQVSDLSPLKGASLQSLDIQETQVQDLQPLAGMQTLKRLNISGTPVTDVSALRGLQLERITLTPENISKGMEVLREMPSLQQILTSMEGGSQQSAAEFWTKYESGLWDQPVGENLPPDETKQKDAQIPASEGSTD